MQPLSIVIDFDVLEHAGLGLFEIGRAFVLGLFVFESPEETFGDAVVLAAATRTHQTLDAWRLESLLVRIAQVVIWATGVIAHSNGLTAACSKIAKKLKRLKVEGYPRTTLEKNANQLKRVLSANGESVDAFPLGELLPGCPAPGGTSIPEGYWVDVDGVSVGEGSDRWLIMAKPVVICARLCAPGSGNEFLQIAFRDGDRWKKTIAPRRQIANACLVVNLADYGFPVTSNNAPAVVKYLHELEITNADYLTPIEVTHRFGWHNVDDEWGFQLGEVLLTRYDNQFQPEGVQPKLIWQPVGEGEPQFANGFRSNGDLEQWMAAVAPAMAYPQIAFCFYGALSAVLLELFDVNNYVIDLSGPTSRGKTSARHLR